MKIKYDKKTDGVYFILSSNEIDESDEIAKDVIVDYDKDDNIVAIEVLNFSSKKEEINLPIDLKIAS